MDVVLLHNESAGDEDWSRTQLMKLIRTAGLRARYFELDEALENPGALPKADFVIVAGGDGSLRKAALAFFERQVPIAPLPLGTANNIAMSLGLPREPGKIVAGWRKPHRVRFDVGAVHGPWGTKRFVEGVGVGLIGKTIVALKEIADTGAPELKKAKHRLLRDACVATALAREIAPLAAKLEVDGRVSTQEFLLLEILNIGRAGPALELVAHASSSDGKLDLVTATEAQRARLVGALKDHLAKAARPRRLPARRATMLRLTPHAACDLRIDDGTVRLRAHTRIEIALEARALELVLPRQARVSR